MPDTHGEMPNTNDPKSQLPITGIYSVDEENQVYSYGLYDTNIYEWPLLAYKILCIPHISLNAIFRLRLKRFLLTIC